MFTRKNVWRMWLLRQKQPTWVLLQISQNARENTCGGVSFHKVAVLRHHYLTLTREFSCKFRKIFRNTFFIAYLRVTASNKLMFNQLSFSELSVKRQKQPWTSGTPRAVSRVSRISLAMFHSLLLTKSSFFGKNQGTSLDLYSSWLRQCFHLLISIPKCPIFEIIFNCDLTNSV